MFNNNKILVVIPAKGVSKGIPRKYVRLLNNKPLIYYAINIAKSSQYVDDVVVTTDDSEIASISEKFGVSVIRRSKELSGEDILWMLLCLMLWFKKKNLHLMNMIL